MINKNITIYIQNETSLFYDQYLILLSEPIIKKEKIPINQQINLKFGTKGLLVKVLPSKRNNALIINELLAKELGLNHKSKVRVKYSPFTLTIGPFIGVLLNQHSKQSPSRPFGSNTSFCQELSEAGKQQGAVVCFFTPEDIILDSNEISCMVYFNGWSKKKLPFPNIIYNRLNSRKIENKSSVQHFIKEVKSKQNGQVFNEKYLNKNQVFSVLSKDASLHKYLPESHLLKNYSMLRSMCNKYRTVFLKPSLSSLGKGIIRITRQSDHTYVCHFTNVNGTHSEKLNSLKKVFSKISGKLKSRKYQIQRGISPITVNNRPVDFRALAQKNLNGEWEVTSVVGRIASDNQFVSNIARGGTLSSVKEALVKSSLPNHEIKRTLYQLNQAALKIAEGLDAQILHHYAELGIDLIVDRYGNVWMIEVNSKPSKNDNTFLNDNKIRPSVKKTIQYAHYLTFE
ncbi:YheC/YheD family endospore coat-associated protein [Chengkuizengella axinellae]|uniref:YheC/YheD family protein n=1 Tax=Chengkuizengella axinellae TaxID=3064388 RepID=A0ABT9IYG2_9BACL|nr:YheC/YheD family protein [Chengkuizengella sp. 2205SS18-9]MDP5274399.1 YheC/YheD family protein [Chengkuizengella sp. 2205SS18-9]